MKQKSLKINAAMNTIRTISTLIFPLITFPYTSRILGPEGSGKISFATSFVSYFVLLASIGVPMYGIREIARVRDNKKILSKTTQELLIMHLVISVLVFIGFILLIFINGKFHDEKALFFISSFSIIMTTLGVDWLYQGLEEYVYITIRSLVVSLISIIAIFIFIHNKEDYIISAFIGVCAAFGSSVLNFYNARKIIFTKHDQPWEFFRHIKPLSIVFLMNFIISIYVQLDTVMLGFMSSAINVGYYSSALKLTKMLLGLVVSIGGVLLPRLSYYIANNLMEDFNKLLVKSINIILLLCFPIVAALMILGREVIMIIAGPLYLPATNCVIITAPIILFIGLSNVFGIQILYPMGKDLMVIISVAVGAIISAILNIILIPTYVHVGAAIATFFGELAVFIFQILILPKYYKLDFPIINIYKYSISTISLILFLVIIKIGIHQEWLRIIIAFPFGILIYFMVLLLLEENLTLEIVLKLRERLIHV